jgi:hypothetical protein
MTTTPQPRPFEELRASGLLHYVNRVALHPRGFAIALHYPDDAAREDVLAGRVDPIGWSIEGDGLEVWSFTEADDDEGFARIEGTLAAARLANGPKESLRRLKRQKAAQEPDLGALCGLELDPNPSRSTPLTGEG